MSAESDANEGTVEADAVAQIDVWDLLERSVTKSEPKKQADESEGEAKEKKTPPWKTLRWKLFFLAADLTGLVVWSYFILKVFVFDIDREIVESIAPSAAWIVDYRVLALPAIAALSALFLWRLLALAFLMYLIFFPVIVIFWKLPWFIAKRRSWTFVMVAAHAAANLLRNFRYITVSKSLWLLSAAAILLFDIDVVTAAAAVCLLVLLSWSVFRVTLDSFRSDWFLRTQQSVIEKIMNSSVVKSYTRLTERDIPVTQEMVLTEAQANDVAIKIQSAAILNRALYFWAYRLKDYRRSQTTLIMNSATYAAIFIGSALTFGLANLALLKVDSAQFSFTDDPSNLEMITYGMSTMFWGAAGGVSADGDVAYLLVIAAGLFGPLFLAVFVVNLLFVLRRERTDTDIADTVEELRQQARRHEADFKVGLRVSVAEAIVRLNQLGLVGFLAVADWLTRDVPPDFIDGDLDAT